MSRLIGISTAQLGGATEDFGNKSVRLINNIRDLLTQVIEKHKTQNYTEAEELATRAYMENFELVESDFWSCKTRPEINGRYRSVTSPGA